MVAMRVLEARASCVWVRVPPSAPICSMRVRVSWGAPKL